MKITFPMVLFLVFLVLKLTKVIDWSWWWVSAPMWIPAAIAAICYALVGIGWLLMTPEQRAAERASKAAARLAKALRRS